MTRLSFLFSVIAVSTAAAHKLSVNWVLPDTPIISWLQFDQCQTPNILYAVFDIHANDSHSLDEILPRFYETQCHIAPHIYLDALVNYARNMPNSDPCMVRHIEKSIGEYQDMTFNLDEGVLFTVLPPKVRIRTSVPWEILGTKFGGVRVYNHRPRWMFTTDKTDLTLKPMGGGREHLVPDDEHDTDFLSLNDILLEIEHTNKSRCRRLLC